MMLERATSKMKSVMANVAAFTRAARKTDYEPEVLAEILYYHPLTVAEAMHRLGLLNRREYERRTASGTEFIGPNDRRSKERRGAEPHSWGSFF